jgi:hypothetical protein
MIRATAQELGFKASNNGCAMQYLIACASFTTKMPIVSTHAHPVVRLLAEVFKTLMYSSDPYYHTVEYQQSLHDLGSRLKDVQVASQKSEDSSDDCKALELTRLAGLIYLERVSRNFSGNSSLLSTWAQNALTILATLKVCPPLFALFIIGCELHTDEDRMVILDFFTRLEHVPHRKSLLETKGLIQTAWIQNDLEVDGELEYVHKINLVMSSRNVVPSFM